MNNILGATAKGAIADTGIGLYRQRGQAYAKMLLSGRDIEERALAIAFQTETGLWSMQGDAREIEISAQKQEILEILEDLGEAPFMKIFKLIEGKPDRGNTSRRLQKLVEDGLVITSGPAGRGTLYSLVEPEKEQL